MRFTEPGCEPPCSDWFTRELVNVAGTNPYEQPILRCVSGRTATRLFDGRYVLRYPQQVVENIEGYEYQIDGVSCFVANVDEIPDGVVAIAAVGQVEIGEPHFYIERWRDPEFLKASGRFKFTHDNGETLTFFECRNCGSEVPTRRDTIGMDVQRICPQCGSKRVSPKDIREEGEGRLLPDLPREGYYDYYAKLERLDGTPHEADPEALMVINAMWIYEHTHSLKERNEHMRAERRPHMVRPGTSVFGRLHDRI